MASPSPFKSARAFSPGAYTRAAIDASCPFASSSPCQLDWFGSDDCGTEGRSQSSTVDFNHVDLLCSQDGLLQSYTCCGTNLPDLHALAVHLDSDPSQPHSPVSFPNTLPNTLSHMHAEYAQQVAQPQPQRPPLPLSFYETSAIHYQQQRQRTQVQDQHFTPSFPATSTAPLPLSFDPSEFMRLDVGPSSVPSSPYSPPHASPVAHTPVTAQAQAPYLPAPYSTISPQQFGPSPASAFDATAVLNAYPAFSAIHDSGEHDLAAEYSVSPAMLFRNQQQISTPSCSVRQRQRQQQQQSAAVTTAVAAAATRDSLLHTEVSDPQATTSALAPALAPNSPTSSNGGESPSALMALGQLASSLVSAQKPFLCPKPNCSKSYKQANGLKYHLTHGSCTSEPQRDYKAVHALLSEKGFDSADTLTESDAREVQREAELCLRPFACGIGNCTRRYKNMNGLRYHFNNTREHGMEGLRLLASGLHESLQDQTSAARRRSRLRTRTAAARGAPLPM